MCAILVSFILWSYAVLLASTWFLAGITPDKAVLLRIAAGFFSDIVWIPFGLALWGWFAYRFMAFLTRDSKKRILYSVMTAFFTVVITLYSSEYAFRFLIVPLLFASFAVIADIVTDSRLLVLFGRLLPLAVIMTLFILYYDWQLIPKQKVNDSEGAISVMTYNILGNARVERRTETIAVILREHPDIVCLTEFNPQTDPVIFKNELNRYYPYMITNRSSDSWLTGEAIFSRFPLDFRPDDATGTANYLSVIADIEGKTVRIVTIHLTRVGRHELLDSLGTLRKKAIDVTQLESMNDKRKLRQAFSIFDRIEHETLPTILCGDFNDTPNGRVCRLFDSIYRDAFKAKGWGLGGTYGEEAMKKEFDGNLFLNLLSRDIIRIDHIYVSSNIDIVSSNVIKDAPGSDHKPLMAVLRIKEDAAELMPQSGNGR